jgi:hypothetical protein
MSALQSWNDELVCSSTDKGPLRIAFPHKVLDAWFPQLFADLPVHEPQLKNLRDARRQSNHARL